jgi:hypothetical protein
MDGFIRVRRRGLWIASALAAVAVLLGLQLLKPPMTDSERASWSSRFADRHAYPDSRLRDMEEASDPEMAGLLNAEIARRRTVMPSPQDRK